MIKVKIIRESLREELLDEAKEDDAYEKYWKKHERDFRPILRWIYGRHLGPGMWQGIVPDMIKKYKDKGNKFAPERQNRIKYLQWATNMHQLGYTDKEIIDSLDLFHKYSSQLKNKAIKSYTSPAHLINAYKEEVVGRRTGKARKERGKSEKRASEDDRTVIYEDKYIFVIRPHHVEASCHYGRKTKWCIAQPGNQYFDDYTQKEAKVFYFIKDDRRKPDDQYAMVAVQIGLAEDRSIVVDGYWDRYDNEDLPIERREPKPINELDKFFGDEISAAMDAISDHAIQNPPIFGEAAKLEALDEEIYTSKFNKNNLNFSSEMDEGYDGISASLRIDINFDGSMRLEELYDGDKDIADIRAAIEDYESVHEMDYDLTQFVATLDWPLSFDNWPDQFEEDGAAYIDGDRININIHYDSPNFEDSDDAKGYIQNAISDHEDMMGIWNSIRDFVEERLSEFMQQDNLQAIRDIAGGISTLSPKLKNLDVTYDEENTEIIVFMKEGYEIPMKFRSFNMPVKGGYSNAEVTRQVGVYASAIRRAMYPLKDKLSFALDIAFNKLEDQMNQQTQLKFKGFKPKEPIKFKALNRTVSISTPNAASIMGKSPGFRKPVEPMQTLITFGFIIDRSYSVEDIKQTFRYLIKLDSMVDDIIKMALDSFDVNAAYKQVNNAYESALVKHGSIAKAKEADDIDPQAYTESKKRRKFKVRILK